MEVLADEVRGAAPGGGIQEVGDLLAVAPAAVTVAGNTQVAIASAAAGFEQLDILDDTAHDGDFVQHFISSFHVLLAISQQSLLMTNELSRDWNMYMASCSLSHVFYSTLMCSHLLCP